MEEDDNADNIDGVPSPKRRRIQENDPLISSDDDTDSSSCGCDDLYFVKAQTVVWVLGMRLKK